MAIRTAPLSTARRLLLAFAVAALAAPVLSASAGASTLVRLHTSLGEIDLVLLTNIGGLGLHGGSLAGRAEAGDYQDTFFHRVIPNYIVQLGGFTFDGDYRQVPERFAIPNAPLGARRFVGYGRGTIGLARLGAPELGPFPGTCDPVNEAANTGTSQFFINLKNNAQDQGEIPIQRVALDPENPQQTVIFDCGRRGFTSFGYVMPYSMPVVDAIAALPNVPGNLTVDHPFAAAFTNLPLLEPLQESPGGYGCVDADPNDPVTGEDNITDTCADDVERQASLQARVADLSAQVPERLVRVDQTEVLPLAYGGVFIDTPDRPLLVPRTTEVPVIKNEPDGAQLPLDFGGRIRGGGAAGTAEWLLDLSPDGWSVTDVASGLQLEGEVERSPRKRRRLRLLLDPAEQQELVDAATVAIEDAFSRAVVLSERARPRVEIPYDNDKGAPVTSKATLSLRRPPKVRAILKRRRNLVRVKAVLKLEGEVTTRVNIFPEIPDELVDIWSGGREVITTSPVRLKVRYVLTDVLPDGFR